MTVARVSLDGVPPSLPESPPPGGPLAPLVLLNNFVDKSVPSWYSVLVTACFSNSPLGRSRRLGKGPEANKERPDVYEK